MALLAIQGHSTRGKEVISLLEMLGGINDLFKLDGLTENFIYYIYPEHNNNIYSAIIPTNQIVFTLEQFEEKFPYKIGDKVYNIIHNENQTITKIAWDFQENEVVYQTNNNEYVFVNYLQPYKEETMETAKLTITPQYHYNEDKIELCVAKDYEIKEENGKYYAVKKQSKYPKTYEECCDILQLEHTFELKDLTMDEEKLIDSFIRLKRCRDAYWKIAGKQMGLGKPWEPDWENKENNKYCITTINRQIKTISTDVFNYLLIFPTAEIRDAFYENFKELIEICKELL